MYDPFRNYDAWVTRDPREDWPEPWELQHHCQVCGCWLKVEPDRAEDQSYVIHCEGPNPEKYGEPVAGWVYTPCDTDCKAPHDFTEYAGVKLFFTCSHCGYINETVDY